MKSDLKMSIAIFRSSKGIEVYQCITKSNKVHHHLASQDLTKECYQTNQTIISEPHLGCVRRVSHVTDFFPTINCREVPMDPKFGKH